MVNKPFRTQTVAVVALTLLVGAGGCQSEKFSDFEALTQAGAAAGPPAPRPDSLLLREGDVIKISFPGSPNMNTTQQIRRDGKISLQLVGEMAVVGMTTGQLEKKLAEVYDKQLLTKEVNVVLESSAFYVYVTGSVGKPGKIVSDRPMTVLEAVIDAGVDYSKANLKAVTVIRREGNRQEYHTFNLKKVLRGEATEQFYLKPSDIVFVRERFTWF
jgi:polysaccharide export outer membrane protein